MEYRSDGLNAVNEPRAWPDNEAVRVDRPHRYAGQLGGDQLSLLTGARQVVAAGRDDGNFGARSRDVGPGGAYRSLAGSGRNRLPAGSRDKVGYPVPRRKRRVDPFDDGHPWTASARDCLGDPVEPGLQSCHQVGRSIRRSGRLAYRQDRRQHVRQRVRIERQHVGAAAEVVKRIFDVAGRYGADTAEVLRQDQLGLQPGQCLRVERVEIRAGAQLRAHVAVDLGRAHATGVPARYHHGLVRAGSGWFIALKRDAHEVAAEAQRVDDLGCRGQQGDDAHSARLAPRYHGGEMPGGFPLPKAQPSTQPDLG